MTQVERMAEAAYATWKMGPWSEALKSDREQHLGLAQAVLDRECDAAEAMYEKWRETHATAGPWDAAPSRYRLLFRRLADAAVGVSKN